MLLVAAIFSVGDNRLCLEIKKQARTNIQTNKQTDTNEHTGTDTHRHT